MNTRSGSEQIVLIWTNMAGNIIIIEAKDNFQKVAKDIIFSKEVDVLTLGIYVKVLCLGKAWKLNVKGLASKLHLSTDKIRSSFATLEKAGYLRRTRTHGPNGRFVGWDYEICSVSFADIAKTPTSVNSDDGEKPTSGKRASIDKDIVLSNKDYESKTKTREFQPPSRPDVVDYARSRGWTDPEGFADFYLSHHQASGWVKSDGRPVTNWKQNVLSWERYNMNRSFPRTQDDTGRMELRQMSADEFMIALTK